ncbi:MAG: BMP family ABC transporter substrate-binding protein [Anaerolineae bacterium]|nr:BMP family ABC transporter substrate-binding protein [Anaerolineae bacterium]
MSVSNKVFKILLQGGLLIVLLFVSACAPAATPTPEPTAAPKKVALVINGTLGDLGFFDSANNGVVRAGKDFGMDVKVIEATYDTNKWEPALIDAANGPYDVIIAGTFNMKEMMEKVAPQFPDKQFILFDVSADFEKCPDCKNIYGIVYRYNEAGYLAGALAAKVTSSDMSRANADKVVGFVGGMDIPVIQNFLVGYEKGIKDTDPEVKLLTAFAGDFNDPAKGKQLTEQMVDNGADVVWAVAGATGLGVYEAALEKDIYAIAVNENQVKALLPNNAGYADTIAGAAIANVGQSLYIALESYSKGTMVSGQNVSYGVKDGVVDLENNEYYQKIVSEDIRQQMEALKKEIVDGKIEIPSVGT